MLLNKEGKECYHAVPAHKIPAPELESLREVLVPATHKGNALFRLEERANLFKRGN